MIRPLMRDPFFLGLPCEEATPADASVGQDLLDTLAAHAHECVGMGANMIGVRKRVIVFDHDGTHRLMYNPVLEATAGPYQTEESCLSLTGSRPTQRFKRITVRYLDERFTERTESFSGWTAQIIQHEIDHCNGVVI
ncbi:MAG: peptide deformylase [Coriobacteriia bacterium]|nr:peptide deformylase [Coriobacteriia bacterium]